MTPKEKRAEWYVKNRERERERSRQWYKRHKESEIAKNAEYRKQNRELFDWYHDKSRFEGVREVILKRDNRECQLCQSTEKLVVHHIDGKNHTAKRVNNDLENLITLCSPDHNALHHWQRQNRQLISREDIVRTLGKPKERNHYGRVRRTFLKKFER